VANNEYDSLVSQQATPANEYDQYLADDKAQQKSQIQQSMFQASQTEPDRRAEVLRLSEKTSLPPNIVERNFETVSKKNTTQDMNYDEIIEKSPSVARFLEHPDNAAVSRDDLPALQKVEETVQDHHDQSALARWIDLGLTQLESSFAKMPGAIADGLVTFPANVKAKAFNSLAEFTGSEARRDYIKTPDIFTQNPIIQSLDEHAQEVSARSPELSQSIVEEAGKGNYKAAAKALVAQVVANAPNQALLIALAARGMHVEGLAVAGATVAAGSAAENKAAETDPLAGHVDAVVKGGIEAGFEELGTFGILHKWEGAIARNYGKQVSREVIKDFAKTIAASAIGEGNEEFLTNIAQDYTDYVTGVNPDAMRGEFGRAVNAGLVGAASGVALTAPGGALGALQRQAQINQADRTKRFYLALGPTLEATKLRERLPEAQKKLVEEITKDSPVENVYVPVEKFDTYFQSAKDENEQPLNPVAVVQDMGLLEQYNEAKETGGDVKIPLAVWADKFVGTEHYQGLANDVKFSADGLTVNEANLEKEIAKQIEAQLKAEAEKAKASPQEQKTQDSAAQVGQTVAEQLKAAGVDPEQAVLYESAFRTLGQRTGQDPLELFNRFKLSIGMGDKPGQQVADPAEEAHYQRILEQSAKDAQGIPDNVVNLADERIKRQIQEEGLSNPDPEVVRQYQEAELERRKQFESAKKQAIDAFGEKLVSKLSDRGVEMLGHFSARFNSDKSPKAYKAIKSAQKEDLGPYVNSPAIPGIGWVPNYAAKPTGVIGPARISESHNTDYSKGVRGAVDGKSKQETDPLKWSDSKFGATKELIRKHKEAGMPLVINTSSDLIAHSDYIAEMPKDTTVNLYAGTRDERVNRILFPGNPSTLRLEKAAEELKAAGIKVNLIRPSFQDVVAAAGGDAVIKKKWGDDSWKNAVKQALGFQVLQGGKAFNQSSISDLERQREIDKAFNSPDSIERYIKLPGSEGGKFVDTDLARELLPAYAASREGAILNLDDTDGPAGRLAAKVWEHMLAQPTDHGYAHILAGGSASGKTYYRTHFKEVQSADVVFDTTSANYERTKERIQQALDSGRPVLFTYIFRNFDEALAANAARFNETGRLVTPDYMAHSHVNALENFLRLKEEFKGDPRVTFEAFNNSKENLPAMSLAQVDKERYNATVGTEALNETRPKPGAEKGIPQGALGQVDRQNEGGAGQDQSGDQQRPAGHVQESATERLTRLATDFLKPQTEEIRATKERAGGPKTLNQSAVPQPQIQPPFYSKLERLVSAKMGNSATIDQVKALLKDVKDEERKWSGIDDFLKQREQAYARAKSKDIHRDAMLADEIAALKNKGQISKQELLEFLRLNQLDIKEVTKGGATAEEVHGEYHYEYDEDIHRYVVKDWAGNELESFKREEDADAWIEDRAQVENATKFSQYTLPGGENYREVLFTLPVPDPGYQIQKAADGDGWEIINASGGVYESYPNNEKAAAERSLKMLQTMKYKDGAYASSHFDEPNVLAHTRLNDRVDADGKRVLFVEELQSDWHQAGRRKGYRAGDLDAAIKPHADRMDSLSEQMKDLDPKSSKFKALFAEYEAERNEIETLNRTDAGGVPDAPFRKTWHEFVLKRLIRMAVEQGYDRIAWTTGEQQAERYDLSKQIDEINYGKIKGDQDHLWVRILDKKGDFLPLDSQGFEVHKNLDDYTRTFKVPKSRLEDVVGKEIAERMVNGEGEKSPHGGRALKDTGLKVGGEGMRGFYDKIIPDFLNKFAKKFGAKVGETQLEISPNPGAIPESATYVGPQLSVAQIRKLAEGQDARTSKALSGFANDIENGNDMESASQHLSPYAAEVMGGRLEAMSKQEKVHSLEITPALKDAALYEGFSLFQGGDQGPRGQIQIGEGGINIKILRTADESTFFHETGHFYLEVLSTIASQENAPDQIKQDLDIIRQWVGAEEGKPFSTEQHETFARGFEAYLMEGRAPSPGLRSAFARFKVWLIAVYRQLKSLNVQLTDEVRGVMDRLLATDEEINQAMGRQSMEPLFLDPASFGLTGEKLERYKQARGDARLAAEEQITAKVMADFKREKEAWWKKEHSRIRSEIDSEVSNRKIYRALSIIQRGKLPDGSALPEGMPEIKLSRKALVEQYGKDFLKKLPRPYVYSTEGGLHPDVAAELLGFESGDDLVTQIANSTKKDDLVAQMADQRMRELHPSLVEGPQFSEEAMAAVHNDKRSQVLRLELEHLASNDMPALKDVLRRATRRPPSDKAIREKAAQIVGVRKVGDVSPYLFQRAEAKAAKEAGEKLAQGDFDGAYDAKMRELLNHELFRAATSARDDIEKAIEDFKKVSRPDDKIAKTRDLDLVNAARAILATYGLGKSDQGPDVYLEQIKRYDPETYATVEALVGSVQATAGPYKEVRFDDFMAMTETVRSLWDLARSTRQIEIDGQAMDKEKVVEELKVHIENLGGNSKPPGYDKAVSNWDKAKLSLMGIKAALRRVESWVDTMDAGDINGSFRRYIWNPISDATSRYRLVKKDTLQKYLEIVKAVEKTLTQKEIRAPELGYTFSGKQELLGAILHTGNDSNLSKLLRGRQWGDFDLNDNLDTSRWDNFIRRMWKEGVLTKADYDFAQNVWDLLEETKPQAQKVHKRLYGHYFSEITAQEIQTPFGVYRGGYVPAIADPFIAQDAAIREEKAALEGLNNSFMFPTAGRGFTKKRVEAYAKPLALDLRFIPSHLDKVMRFIHLEPHVKEVGRLVMDRSLRNALDTFDPAAGGDMLVPWLQRVALQKLETPSSGWGGRAADAFFRGLRTRVGLQIMSANVTNALQQVSGLSISAIKVEPKYLRDSLWNYIRAPKQTAEDISQKSDFMKTKLTSTAHEIQAAIDDMLLNPSKYEQVRDFARQHGYFLTSGMQNFVDTITWSGAYDQAVAEGKNELEAVRTADSAVRLTQGTFAVEDVSRFETGSPFVRSFTMFYSYFNMQANLLGSEFTKIWREMGLKKGAGKTLYLYAFGFMIPALIAEMIVRGMSGKGLDEDDDGEYLNDILSIFFGSQFRGATAMIPAAGQAINAGVNMFNDKWYDDRISTSPAVSMIESAVSAPHSVYKAIAEDGNKKKATRDLLTALGLLSGMPLAPLSRPIGYLSDVAEGNAQPSGPIDFARGLVTGRSGESR
jgi:hypothetical protein